MLSALSYASDEAWEGAPLCIKPFGKYVRHHRIGRGRFGEVFAATWSDASGWHRVAIKTIAEEFYTHGEYPKILARFEREIAIMKSLDHPSILRVIDDGEEDGVRYFVTPYVDGKDLLHFLGGKTMPVADAVELFLQLTDAVSVAHCQGVLHRDLKPHNILIDKTSKKPYLADFGLAKRIGAQANPLTQVDEVAGTRYYMPPEQADPLLGKPSSAMDVYALGVSLYQVLTGETPFPDPGRTYADLQTQILWDNPRLPSLLNSKIPKQIDLLCLICLQKFAEDRYPSATELHADLLRCQQGEPILGQLPTFPKRVQRWAQRRTPELAISAALATIAIVAIIFAYSALIRADENEIKFKNAEGRTAIAEQKRTEIQGQLTESESKVKIAEELKNESVTKATAAERQRSDAVAKASEAVRQAEETEARNRESQYVSDLQDIERAYERNDVVRVRSLLDREIPKGSEKDLRGVEWYYWDNRLRMQAVVIESGWYTHAVAINSGGGQVAVAGDERVSVWDISNRSKLFDWSLDTGQTKAFARNDPIQSDQRVTISPNGKWLAATGFRQHPERSGALTVWALADGQEKLRVRNNPYIGGHAVIFSPDSSCLLAGGLQGGWLAWNTESWEPWEPNGSFDGLPGSIPNYTPRRITNSGPLMITTGVCDLRFIDGGRVLTASPPTAFWSWPDGIQQNDDLRPGDDGVGIEKSSNHITLLTMEHRIAELFNPHGGGIRRQVGNQTGVSAVAFFRDNVAIADGDHAIQVWAIQPSGPCTPVSGLLRGHANEVVAIAFDPTGQVLVSSDSRGTLLVHRLAADSTLYLQREEQPPKTARPAWRWDAQRNRVIIERIPATSSEREINEIEIAIPHQPVQIAFISRARYAAITWWEPNPRTRVPSSSLIVWDLTKNQEVASVQNISGPDLDERSLTGDGNQLVITFNALHGGVAIFNGTTGLLTTILQGQACAGAHFSPSGRLVAVTGDWGTGVFDIQKSVWLYRSKEDAVQFVFDATETRLAWESHNPQRRCITIDLATKTEIPNGFGSNFKSGIQFSKNGERIYVPTRDGIEIYLASSSSKLATLNISGVFQPPALTDGLERFMATWKRARGEN